MGKRVVFIDSDVPDLQDLLDWLAPDVQAFVLDASSEGIQQIADILAANNWTGLSSISIVGHGAAGQIDIGSIVLDDTDLSSYSATLAQIGAALAPGGSFALYACDVASGASGQQFITDLSQFSGGVDVQAATQAVGRTGSGVNWTLDASTGPNQASADVPFTASAQESFQGQLASGPVGQLYFRINQGNDVQLGDINSDGSARNTIYTGGGNDSSAGSGGTGNETSVAVDPAAGLVFSVGVGNKGSYDAFSVHNLYTGALISTTEFGPNTGSASTDDVVQALTINPFTDTLYVGDWGSTTDSTGVREFTYNPANGALTPVSSNGGFLFTATQTETTPGNTATTQYTNANAFYLDTSNHLLYYVDDDSGYNTSPFHATNSVYVVSTTGPSFNPIELTSNGTGTGQFPVANQPGTFIGAHGNLVGLAVDIADGIVFFESTDVSGSSNNALWWVSASGGANQTAHQITLPAGVTLNFAGQSSEGGDAAGLTFDPQEKQLYLTNAENSTTTPNLGAIYVLQWDNTTKTVSLVRSFDTATLVGTTPSAVNSFDAPSTTTFDVLPTLTEAGTATHAVERGAAVTLLASTPTITDPDGDHLASATVQITGGTFTVPGNDSSANDDHLEIAGATSGTVSGTNITFSYNSATETLTLTGYDTFVDYQTALSEVQYFTTGHNPTNYGLNPTRTITWQVNDGAIGNPSGPNNTQTTTLNIDAVNDAPVATVPASYTGAERAPLNLQNPGLTVSDVDGGIAGQNETATLSVSEGILKVAVGIGASSGALVSGSGTNQVIITGDIAQIDGVLNSDPTATLTYTGNIDADDNPSFASLSLSINDNGFTGSGGPLNSNTAVSDITAPDDTVVSFAGLSGGSTGNPVEGRPVSATITDGGLAVGSATYTWKVAGTTVQSGSANIYTPTEMDEGKALTLDVSFQDPGDNSISENDTGIIVGTVQESPTENATISLSGLTSGNAVEGQQITAAVTDADAPASGITYTWTVNGVVVHTGVDTAGNTYTPTEANEGLPISVSVSFTDTHGFAETGTTSAGTVQESPTENATISLSGLTSGNAVEGQQITAAVADADAPASGITYTWTVNGVVVHTGVDAAGNTYTPTEANEGLPIGVSVSFTDTHGFAETGTASAGTVQESPTENATISLSGLTSGNAVEGLQITAAVADADAPASGITYTWTVNGVVVHTGVDAAGNTYTPTEANEGLPISVSVSFTDTHGFAETGTASAGTVQESPTENATISLSGLTSGNAVEGQQITAAVADADAPASGITYAWTVNGVVVHTGVDAAGNTYTPTEANEGLPISVSVSFTDTHGFAETGTVSAGTVQESPTENATISLSGLTSGNAVEGQQITAAVADADAPASGITYTWTVNGVVVHTGVDAAGNTYTPTEANEGLPISVSVSFTDTHGFAETGTVSAGTVQESPTENATISLSGLTSGNAVEGQQITAAVADADAPASGITYTWTVNGVVVHTGVDAAGNTYTPTEANEGLPISVSVSFTDTHGFAETGTASAGTVQENPTENATISLSGLTSGNAVEGQQITAAVTDADAPASGITYTWTLNRVVVHTGVDAAGNTYTPTEANEGLPISVSVSFTDTHGFAETGTISAGTVQENPTENATISLSGLTSGNAVEGQQITAAVTDADAPASGITYTWTVNGVVVHTGVDAAGNTYTPTDANKGLPISVSVSFTDTLGFAETGTISAGIVQENATISLSGLTSGNAVEGQQITATVTNADAPASGITYTWTLNGVVVHTGVDAAGNTYTPTEANEGLPISVSVSFTDTHGFAETGTASAGTVQENPTENATISLSGLTSGNAVEGQQITAAVADADAPASGITYTWTVNGVVVHTGVDAAGNTYTPTEANEGLPISVSVSFTDTHGFAETGTTSAGTVQESPTENATISLSGLTSGNAVEGQQITAAVADADAPASGITYTWTVNGVVVHTGVDAAGNTYTPTEANEGLPIGVSVSFTDTHGFAETGTASAGTVQESPTENATISLSGLTSGNAVEGQQITAAVTDADAPASGITYTWTLNGVVVHTGVDAAGNTYTPTEANEGLPISVSVSFTDTHGFAETGTISAGTVQENPTENATISLSGLTSGNAVEGQQITAAVTDADAPASGITYTWTVNGVVVHTGVDAAGNTYTPTEANEGLPISVSVSFTDTHGFAETGTASAGTVQESPTENATISLSGLTSGNAVEGQQITAAVTDADAPASGITYTWTLNGVVVHTGVDAAGNTYTPTEANEGLPISVSVSFTDTHGFAETGTASAGTVQESPTENATISLSGLTSGNAVEGQQITAAVTDADAPASGITYTWTLNGVVVHTGVDAAGNTYTPTEANEGLPISVSVSFTDTHGFAETGTISAGTVTPPARFLVTDLTTGQSFEDPGTAYSGPVSGLQHQYLYTGGDNLAVASLAPNSFIHTGSGEDAIDVSKAGGTNVLDGGANSNFLVGGSGAGSFDTFFVDDRSPSEDIWSTIVNFHADDAVTVFGVTPSGFNFAAANGEGAPGYTGLTLHITAPGMPTASLTLSGLSTADLTNGGLTESFGTESDGTPYLYIEAHSSSASLNNANFHLVNAMAPFAPSNPLSFPGATAGTENHSRLLNELIAPPQFT